MSSRGELFITEDIPEAFGEELKKAFGPDYHLIIGAYYSLWNVSLFPDELEVEVDGEVSGRILVKVKFSVAGDSLAGRYIAVEPESFKVL